MQGELMSHIDEIAHVIDLTHLPYGKLLIEELKEYHSLLGHRFVSELIQLREKMIKLESDEEFVKNFVAHLNICINHYYEILSHNLRGLFEDEIISSGGKVGGSVDDYDGKVNDLIQYLQGILSELDKAPEMNSIDSSLLHTLYSLIDKTKPIESHTSLGENVVCKIYFKSELKSYLDIEAISLTYRLLGDKRNYTKFFKVKS